MRQRALTAGLLLGVGIGVAGTLALQAGGADPRPVPQAESYGSAAELIAAMRASGVPCTLQNTWGKYPVCQLPDGGPILTVRSAPGGWFTGGAPTLPTLVGPNWVVTADESNRSDVLEQVQRGLGGELRTVPGLPTGPATVVYRGPMQRGGYVPPCRVIPDPQGPGSIGLHYDESGSCPTK